MTPWILTGDETGAADAPQAAVFGLPTMTVVPAAGFYLMRDAAGLGLYCAGSASVLCLDFVSGALAHRRQHGGSEAVVRAVGLKGGQPLTVVDATAGLGRDGFILAAHGATVIWLERHPVLAALLADALQRARTDATTADIAARLSLRFGAAHEQLAAWDGAAPDVVYLDPMFPHRKKSALVKQEMQWLQQLVGSDDDAAPLVALARRLARKRVVVKRPDSAPPLGDGVPTGAVSTRGHRFDLYPPLLG